MSFVFNTNCVPRSPQLQQVTSKSQQSVRQLQSAKQMLAFVVFQKVFVSFHHSSNITTDRFWTLKPLVWRKLEHVVQTFTLGLAHQAHTLKTKHGLFSGFDFSPRSSIRRKAKFITSCLRRLGPQQA